MMMQEVSFLPSTITSMIQSVGSLQSAAPSIPQVRPPPPSNVSAPLRSSSSFVVVSPSSVADAVTTFSGVGRDVLPVPTNIYCRSSTSTLASRLSVSSDGDISGSGLHLLMPTYGATTSVSSCYTTETAKTIAHDSASDANSFFSAGCGSSNSSFTMALRYASTRPAALGDFPPQASGHLMTTGCLAGSDDGESAAVAAGPAYFGAFGTSTAMTPVGSGDNSQPDTLQAMIYQRPFTGAKPPYSYISLITMAIQVIGT